MPGCFPLRLPNLMLLCALCLILSIPWAYPSGAASASRTIFSKHLQHPGSEPWKWVPFRGALTRRYKIDKLAHGGEDDVEERHPADNLLRRHKADMTESYILGGY